MNTDDIWPTITIWIVDEIADSEGRRSKQIGVCFTEDEALTLKGDNGYRSVKSKTVYRSGPFKGVDPEALRALPRYPIDQVMRDAKLEASIQAKLTPQEREYLVRRGAPR